MWLLFKIFANLGFFRNPFVTFGMGSVILWWQYSINHGDPCGGCSAHVPGPSPPPPPPRKPQNCCCLGS